MSKKKLVAFDLDDTLTRAKCIIDNEMARLLSMLIERTKVAIFSGCSFDQMEKQVLQSLQEYTDKLDNLYLFPTCSTRCYRYDNGWKQVYASNLSDADKRQIRIAFEKAYHDTNYSHPKKLYGNVLDDRGSQITFSALGQQAPLEEKKLWDPTIKKRNVLVKALRKYLPKFEVRIGGTTSIDVNKKGMDKSYGIRKIQEMFKISLKDICYVGDALFKNGNDWIVKQTGVECIAVKNPENTKHLIRKFLQKY